MIKIVRKTTTDTLEEMSRNFVFPPETPRELFTRQMVECLNSRPEAVLVLNALNDDGDVVAFIVAEQGIDNSVWILQAWSEPANPQAVIDNLFHRVVLWTVSQSRSRIQVQTSRNADALYRRFRFEEKAMILEHTISPEVFAETFKAVETSNGKSIQVTGDVVKVDA